MYRAGPGRTCNLVEELQGYSYTAGGEAMTMVDTAGRDLEGLVSRAETLLNRGELDEAEGVLRQIVTLDPSNVWAINKLGVVKARRGDLDAAGELFRRAIEVDAEYAPPYSNLGNLRYDAGDYEGALELYQKALAIDPEYEPAYNNMAAAYKKLGRIEEAVRALKKSSRLRARAAGRRAGERFSRASGCLLPLLTLALLFSLLWAMG